jgi:hypothetical protein
MLNDSFSAACSSLHLVFRSRSLFLTENNSLVAGGSGKAERPYSSAGLPLLITFVQPPVEE